MSEILRRRDSAINDLKDRIKDNPDDYLDGDIHDTIFEIADSNVPIYSYDIIKCALDNLDLAVTEPELGPAFDGSNTPVNIIAANIFEYLDTELWDYWSSKLRPLLDGYHEELDEIDYMENDEMIAFLIDSGFDEENVLNADKEEREKMCKEAINEDFKGSLGG